MQRWNAFRPQFDALGVRLVAISPDTPAEAAAMRDRHHLGVRLLSDASLAVTERYNLVHRTFAPVRGPVRPLAIPTTILVDAAGIVRWIDQTPDWRVRSSADRVLAAVRQALAGGDGQAAPVALATGRDGGHTAERPDCPTGACGVEN